MKIQNLIDNFISALLNNIHEKIKKFINITIKCKNDVQK
ncbi:hypothetical protein CLCAR_2943 [Clostridium carboxidivorans P7]|nr:hypothetical protein CLCAR_2943 [Clostridium carboxidivorans P7]